MKAEPSSSLGARLLTRLCAEAHVRHAHKIYHVRTQGHSRARLRRTEPKPRESIVAPVDHAQILNEHIELCEEVGAGYEGHLCLVLH